MLFALVDYWAYKHRTGCYSHKALCSNGRALAVEENFLNWRELPLGHILFVSTSGSLISWIVMYVTDSDLSHVAMIYGDGIVQDVTGKGVHRHPMSDYFDGASYLTVMPPPKGTDLKHVRNFMDQTLGHGYNHIGAALHGLNIIIANHPSFRWRLAADVTFLHLMTAALSFHFSVEVMAATVLSTVAYWLVVLINMTLRRKTILNQFPYLRDQLQDEA